MLFPQRVKIKRALTQEGGDYRPAPGCSPERERERADGSALVSDF